MHGVALPQLPYHSDEWFEARRRSLGASEVAAALGFSTFQSSWSLWAIKTGRISEDEREETPAMRWGKVLEPAILDEFEAETGLHAAYRDRSWRHPDVEWATASPDALAYEVALAEELPRDEFEALGIVEAKTDFGPWHNPREEEPSGAHIPEQYALQAHWQMWVCGLDRAWIPLFASGRRQFHIYELERDERLIEVVVDAATQFWGYVERDEEPPVDAHDATRRALADTYKGDPELTVELPMEAADALAELRQVRMRLKPLEERKAYLENIVKAALADASVGTVAGAVAVTWKPQTSRRVDSARLREELPEIAEKFTAESTYRVLRLKEIK